MVQFNSSESMKAPIKQGQVVLAHALSIEESS